MFDNRKSNLKKKPIHKLNKSKFKKNKFKIFPKENNKFAFKKGSVSGMINNSRLIITLDNFNTLNRIKILEHINELSKLENIECDKSTRKKTFNKKSKNNKKTLFNDKNSLFNKIGK